MGFYYPEGYFGPVCDSPVSDEDIANRSRRAIIIEDLDQEKEVLTGDDPTHFDDGFDYIDPGLPIWRVLFVR